MNVFLHELSEEYPNEFILLGADGAAWHKSKGLQIPKNIEIFPLLPYTPEMNPIEQIWHELRQKGFKNEVFTTLEKVVERLCETICNLKKSTVQSITKRDWILSML
jgi:putative transposase